MGLFRREFILLGRIIFVWAVSMSLSIHMTNLSNEILKNFVLVGLFEEISVTTVSKMRSRSHVMRKIVGDFCESTVRIVSATSVARACGVRALVQAIWSEDEC